MMSTRIVRAAISAVGAALALLLGVAAPAAASQTPSYPHDELIVKYAPGTTHAERDAVRREAGIRSAGTISGSSQLVKVESKPAASASATSGKTAAALRTDP